MKKGKKNYFIAGALFIAVILITLYIFKWYKVVNEEKISESYLISESIITNEINSINELGDVFSESPSEYFLYISYTNDKDVYNMEMKLNKIISKHNLQDKFYYLNIDDIKDNDDVLDKLNNTLGLDNKIKNVPTILYYKDHQYVDGIIVKNRIMDAKDLEKLLDKVDVID